MNKQIVVTGSLAFDTIMDFHGNFGEHILADKIHSLNLSFLVDNMEKTSGGTAGNIAYNLGLLECKPVLLSMFGKDAEEYRDFLKNSGVNVDNAPLSQKYFSSQSFIVTDKNDNQIASFYPGSMIENSKLKIAPLKEAPLKVVVISPNMPEAMNNFVHQCVENKIKYMYDPGMQLPRINDDELRYGIKNSEILIGNDYEIELMKRRVKTWTKKISITTLGEKGAVIFDHSSKKNEQHVISPAKAKEVIDPTGAGDAFRAGFLAGYVRDFDLKICGQMGATCAVYTVEKYGTTTHTFNVVEFAKRYKENYKEKLGM